MRYVYCYIQHVHSKLININTEEIVIKKKKSEKLTFLSLTALISLLDIYSLRISLPANELLSQSIALLKSSPTDRSLGTQLDI